MSFKDYIVEKKQKPKELTGYDYYKSIRKPVPKPGTVIKDKTKYSRKEKHRDSMFEEVSSPLRQISDFLSQKGIKAHEQKVIFDLIGKLQEEAYFKGKQAQNPFKG